MKRREVLTLLGSSAAWPLAARAPQPGKLPTMGFLGLEPMGRLPDIRLQRAIQRRAPPN
jgi:hypothetical protein